VFKDKELGFVLCFIAHCELGQLCLLLLLFNIQLLAFGEKQ